MASNNGKSAYYIIGIYHPPAKPRSQIRPEDRSDQMYPAALRALNDTIVGKPITVMHPPERANCLSGNWGTNVRGKCVWSRVLDDGNAVFIGEMPIDRRNIKTLLTKQAIERGDFESLSLGHTYDEMVNRYTGETRDLFQADHIAIVPTGDERRPGCRILSLSTISNEAKSGGSGAETGPGQVRSMVERIRQENSNFIYQLLRDGAASGKSTETMSTEATQHHAGAPVDVTNKVNNATAQRMAEQQQQNQEAAAQQQQPPAEPTAMTDDAQTDVENRLATQPKEVVSKVAAEMYKELAAAKAQLAELQRERDQIVAQETEQKKNALQQRIKAIEDHTYNLRTVSLDGTNVSEEAKKAHRAEARKAARTFLPVNDDLDSLNRAMAQTDAWASQFSAIQVASVDGASRANAYSRMMNRRDESASNHVRGILRSGISGQNMKQHSGTSARFTVRQESVSASSAPMSSNPGTSASELDAYVNSILSRGGAMGARSSVMSNLDAQLKKAQDAVTQRRNLQRSQLRY